MTKKSEPKMDVESTATDAPKKDVPAKSVDVKKPATPKIPEGMEMRHGLLKPKR